LKNRICIFLLSLSSFIYSAETSSRIVGPGTIYYNYIDKNLPISIHIMEIDLTNPNIDLITQKANSKLAALQQTSIMAQQLEAENFNVIAAINADFFHKDGRPVGIQIAEGIMVSNPYIRSVFGVTDNKKPFIDILSFEGTLFTKKGSCKIDGVNSYRQDDELILFNNYIGISNKTNKWGVEVIANYLNEPCVNDTCYLVAIARDKSMDDDGNKDIPGFGVVLSAHGKKAEFLQNNIQVGDTLKMLLQLPPVKRKIIEAVSGAPQIIKNGRIKIDLKKESLPASFSTTRHPRTAVGYNRDKTKLYLFVADGRQSEYSIGMSLRELAKFMLDWGVHNGINLDGGGSSTMYVRGNVVNRPSDTTGERKVTNALMVLCKNKSDRAHVVSLLPQRLKIEKSGHYQFEPMIFDKYYNPLPNKEIVWSYDKKLGILKNDGTFTAGNRTTSGYIYIEADGKKDSSYVIIE